MSTKLDFKLDSVLIYRLRRHAKRDFTHVNTHLLMIPSDIKYLLTICPLENYLFLENLVGIIPPLQIE